MLRKMQLTYIIDDEVLLITSQTEAENKLVVKVYPVADLVLPVDPTSILGGIGGIGGGGGIGQNQGGGQGAFGGGGGGFGGSGGQGGGGFFAVSVVSVFLLAGVYHLVLIVLDGAHATFEATYRAVLIRRASPVFCRLSLAVDHRLGVYWRWS